MEIALSFVVLLLLEILLGIDNIVVILLLTSKLAENKRKLGQFLGLGLALAMRLVLLASAAWIISLTDVLFTVFTIEISWRDIMLIVGGAFLIYKATKELFSLNTETSKKTMVNVAKASFASVIVQIGLVDLVFSIDSVLTAVGIGKTLWVMMAAVIIAVIFMAISMSTVEKFINKYPQLKILALTFIILLGGILIIEGLDVYVVATSYLYFAMFFALLVEMLNILIYKK